MSGYFALVRRIGAAAIVLAGLAAPLAARAQDVPSYAQPSYTISTDETIHGRIRSVDGAFNISVDDDRGFLDSVQLHQGTIINPTGLTLSAGMSVTIVGVNAGSAFSANEIDTPYTYSGPLPAPVYYGAGYWYPGFAYGYGPAFSLAIVFGGGGYGGWSYAHHPFYGRPWSGYGYFGAAAVRVPVSHGSVEVAHAYGNGTERAGLNAPAAHVPTAFAGRSFAEEPADRADRFGTESAAPAQRYSAAAAQRSSPAAQERGSAPAGNSYRAGGYSAGGASGHGYAHGGSARGGGGSHGGGHAR